ncbi:CoA-transferase subunit beta [Desulfofundulus sp. TPOSR]|uniref:CoA-transferase subunit beta n=1 Tax=Desulfofundulus sp. TPOSR TaxID=2714340 RepID=UPI00140D0AA7|nr:CoA-transferase [Desulfofundulus sp. TPOSR]NHM28769.1 CoA-transferase subunit beta [Desulfofundulus sp. TPOSR]
MNDKVYSRDYTPREIMIVAASRVLNDGEKVLVGVGLPMLAAALAKKTRAPNLILMFEPGIIDADMTRMPKAVGDPSIVAGSTCITGLYEMFAYYICSGLLDVGFLGAAQVDRFGNINTTAIGTYERPAARLPGSGGANDIASMAKKIIIIMPHNKRNFKERVDFVTSPGFLTGRDKRKACGLMGGGPEVMVTDKGVFGFSEQTGEMFLKTYHPGVTIEEIQEAIPWQLKIAEDVGETEPPTEEEIHILRHVIGV